MLFHSCLIGIDWGGGGGGGGGEERNYVLAKSVRSTVYEFLFSPSYVQSDLLDCMNFSSS